MVIDDIEMDY